ncbi:MAG: hypothetical protein KJ063_23135 [Anaerolineae bacterium]|nr:hypothetical protein [Anaerolineae bacterium]
MNTSSLLLSFSYHTAHPIPVQERTDIYTDGQVIHLIQAALTPEDRAQAGHYLFHLSDPQQAEAQRLGQALATLPPQPDQNRPEGIQISLYASWNGQSQSHGLSLGFPPTHPTLAEAFSLGQAVRTEAVRHPLAALNFKLKVGQAAVFIIESIGTEPVTFLLQPESLSLQAQNQVIWQNSENQLMGLVDGMGRLVDGLYAAATLTPGTKASMSLPGAPTAPALQANLQGFIALPDNDDPLDSTPDLPFYVSST